MFYRIAICLTTSALLLGTLTGCDLSSITENSEIAKLLSSGKTKKAEGRVTKILEAINADPRMGSVQYQTAVCSWYKDALLITDQGELEVALDSFEDWKSSGGLYSGIRFQIVKSWVDEEANQPTVVVELLLDDQPHSLRVPEKGKISWIWS